MNYRLLPIIVLSFLASVFVDASESALKKLDNLGAAHYRSLISRRQSMPQSNGGNLLLQHDVNNAELPRYLPLILKLKEGADPSLLDQYGVIILKHRESLYLTFVPTARLEEVLSISIIRSARLGVPEARNMDNARIATHTDEALNSEILPEPLDGRGVIVGFSDTGFDVDHINFRTADNPDASRVKKMVAYSDFEGTFRVHESEAGLRNVETDNPNYWHATHVAGCMTGSYAVNGYQGAAPGADIVATCSSLYDATILAGIEEVIAYSKKVGKPSVVNLSVGSYNGPHDGTDLFSQYLDLLGKETIVCISSGNEAIQHSCQAIRFTADKPVFRTAIYDTYYQNGVTMKGFADFWSESDQPFESAICIYDRDEKVMVYESEFSTEASRIFDENHPEFTQYFSGRVEITTSVSTENNRFNTVYDYNMTSREMTTIDYPGKLGRYVFGVVLRGPVGLYAEGYTDSTNSIFHSCGIKGWSIGSNFNCVSNIACGHNVIVVGSYNTRNEAPLVNGGTINYPIPLDENSDFSGFGTLIDGRVLPHITAPGHFVISSVSSVYTDGYIAQYGYEELCGEMSAMVEADGKKFFWASKCGTSMSTPIAAGTIAQWLQIYPELSVEEARDIAMETGSENPPRINALEGARRVASIAGVERVIANTQNRLVVKALGDRRYQFVLLGANHIDVAIYATDGALVNALSSAGDSADVDMSSLQRGVYLAVISDGHSRQASKIVIK